jgi:hypothetical protein
VGSGDPGQPNWTLVPLCSSGRSPNVTRAPEQQRPGLPRVVDHWRHQSAQRRPGGNAGQSCGFGISPRCISSATASGGLTGAALPATGRTVPGRAGCAQPRARIDPSSRGPHRIRDDCTDFVTTPAIHLAASHHRPSAAPASIGRPIARPLTEPSPQSPRAAPPGASSFRRGTRVAGLWASTSAGSG